MKFVALAVAALVGVSNAVELTGKYMNDKKFSSKLMQNAKVYDRSTGAQRKVEEGEQELSAAHSVIFKSCETLSVQVDFDGDGNDDASSANLQQMFQQGAIRSQKSYILFDVCLSDYCYNGDSSYRTTYIVDMASFIGAFVEFIPAKQEAYCQGCQDNADYCSGAYAYNADADAAGDDAANNGGRRLESNLVEYIDCDRCSAYGCSDENGSTVDYSLNWIESMSTCAYQAEEPFYWNGIQITMGFMCNEKGTGVEVAAFLDEDCTLYTNQVSYSSMMSDTEYGYWSNSVQHIEYMFNTGFSCYNPEITYINPYDEAQGTYGDDMNNQDDGQVPEAADWCQAVFEGNMEPADLNNCDANDGGRKLDQYDANQGQYQQQYSLAEEDVQDSQAVCYALTGLGGQGEHLYDTSSSGSLYKYYGSPKDKSENWGTSSTQKSKTTSGVKGTIAFFVIVALVGMGFAASKFIRIKKINKDAKKAPLVKETEEGELA